MALIEWKADYETGVASVDHEHRQLVATINRMHEKLVRGGSIEDIRYYLGEIHAQIEAHFALEEKIMRQINYHGYPTHKADHDRLLEEIRHIMESVEEDPSYAFDEALAQVVDRWFMVHFSTHDKAFHRIAPEHHP